MKTVWTKGLSVQGKDEMTREFQASAHLRKRLSDILEEKREASYRKSLSEDAYASPNWAFQQADSRGFERALTEIMSLLDSKV